jgi:hypothetical protein
LELANVVKVLAQDLQAESMFVDDDTDNNVVDNSSWVLVTMNEEFIKELNRLGTSSKWPDERLVAFWTDDYSSILPLIKWRTGGGWWDKFLRAVGLKAEE